MSNPSQLYTSLELIKNGHANIYLAQDKLIECQRFAELANADINEYGAPCMVPWSDLIPLVQQSVPFEIRVIPISPPIQVIEVGTIDNRGYMSYRDDQSHDDGALRGAICLHRAVLTTPDKTLIEMLIQIIVSLYSHSGKLNFAENDKTLVTVVARWLPDLRRAIDNQVVNAIVKDE